MTSAVDIIIHAVSPESTLGSAGPLGRGLERHRQALQGQAPQQQWLQRQGMHLLVCPLRRHNRDFPERSINDNARNIGTFLKFFTFYTPLFWCGVLW